MVGHTCNPRTQEARVGRSQVEDSLGYTVKQSETNKKNTNQPTKQTIQEKKIPKLVF
jgi:hypothetical protein